MSLVLHTGAAKMGTDGDTDIVVDVMVTILAETFVLQAMSGSPSWVSTFFLLALVTIDIVTEGIKIQA